jgi:hypothetical protein
MSDTEKFEGFKRTLLADHEVLYGRELREAYGDARVVSSSLKVQRMTPAAYAEWRRLEDQVMEALLAAFKTGDPASAAAQEAAALHRRWLCCVWTDYTPAAHRGLAQRYVDDERFRAYYDSRQAGLAAFLRDVIQIYTAAAP